MATRFDPIRLAFVGDEAAFPRLLRVREIFIAQGAGCTARSDGIPCATTGQHADTACAFIGPMRRPYGLDGLVGRVIIFDEVTVRRFRNDLQVAAANALTEMAEVVQRTLVEPMIKLFPPEPAPARGRNPFLRDDAHRVERRRR